MSRHVLVPFDGSRGRKRGARRALEQNPDATVTLLRVVEPVSETGIARSDAPLETTVEADDPSQSPDLAADTDRVESVVEPGSPASRTVAYADEHDVDAIVVGESERSRIAEFLFGSVSETVAANASVPVRIVS